MSDVPSRVLRETLREQLGPPLEASSECLDVDVLAAWSDGTLSRRDRAAVESHAANCARCQAMLAAMAKTEAPATVRPWWQVSTVRWLVPIAVVPALAVVVWMNTPTEPPVVPAARADRNATASAAPASEAPAAGVAAPQSKATGALERPADQKRGEQPAARNDERAKLAESAPAFRSAQSAPSPPAAPEPPNAPASSARDASVPAPAAVPPPAGLSSAAAPRALAETVTVQETAIADRQSPRPLEIPSPDRAVRWRVVAGTSVQRSADGGITWQAQSTGSSARLTAGAAPSPTICWLVGTGGVVLMSRDGRTWQRVAFPEAIDLTAIRATDDANATATAADGRVFVTTDGGKTWRSP